MLSVQVLASALWHTHVQLLTLRYSKRDEINKQCICGLAYISVTQARFLLINHLLREIAILEITSGVSKCKATAKLHQSKVKYNIQITSKRMGKIKNRTYTNYIIDRAGNFINGTAAAYNIHNTTNCHYGRPERMAEKEVSSCPS